MSSAFHDRLPQFFGGYFHEDWQVEAEDPDGIIDLYMSQADRDQRLGVAEGIDALITSDLSDEAISRMLFEELGCYYDPTPDGLSARAWLQQVSHRLKGRQ